MATPAGPVLPCVPLVEDDPEPAEIPLLATPPPRPEP